MMTVSYLSLVQSTVDLRTHSELFLTKLSRVLEEPLGVCGGPVVSVPD